MKSVIKLAVPANWGAMGGMEREAFLRDTLQELARKVHDLEWAPVRDVNGNTVGVRILGR